MNDYSREKPIGGNENAPVGFSDFVNQFDGTESSDSQRDEKLVVFSLNERLYAIAACDIAEISLPVPLAELPNSRKWLLGIGNLRGDIIAVVNLPAMIGENLPPASAKTKLVVLKPGEYDTTIAFAVDKLSEIIAFGGEKNESAAPTSSSYIRAEFVYRENVVRLIDTRKLLNSLAANA